MIAEIMSAFRQSGFFFSHGVHCCDYCNYNDSNNNCDFSICCRTFTRRCQSKVMGKSSACHQTENSHSGVRISLACKNKLTKRASTKENILLREQLESRYEVANHFPTMNRARVELSAFIQNEGGAPLPEDALGTPEEQGIRAMLIATGEPPREVTLLPDKNGSTLKPLQALVGGNIETFDIAFGEEVPFT